MNYITGSVNMGFYRFRSNVDICGTRISNGAKVRLSGDDIIVTKFTRSGKEIVLKTNKENFFEEMKAFPSILNRMKKNIKRRIRI